MADVQLAIDFSEGKLPIAELTAQFASKGPLPLEMAFRRAARQILKQKHSLKDCLALVAKVIDGSKSGLLQLTLPHLMLDDLMDVSTILQCEEIFAFMESNVHVWAETPFSSSAASFQRLLRICNVLKRRLSKAQNTELCGRILVFLASIVPLTDKSGVNLASLFNTSNATAFDGAPQEIMGATDSIVDVAFYRKLWSLQAFCCAPNTAYPVGQWPLFTQAVHAVLDVFAACKLDVVASMTSSDDGPYFAKYLTSPALLHLQIADSRFRRQVLLQIVIVLVYLKTPTKFKKDLALKPVQAEWVDATLERTYAVMRETPPDGPAFLRSVQHLIQREEGWVAWKNDGCPSFERAPQKRTSEEAAAPRPTRRRVDMGTPQLTQLWNAKDDKRFEMPTLLDFFKQAAELLDPEQGVEEQYLPIHSDTFVWRSLRLLVRSRIDLCQESLMAQKPMAEFLRSTIPTVVKPEGAAEAEPAAAPAASSTPAPAKDAVSAEGTPADA